MRIGEAARRLGLTPRMLRYRESLGLLPPGRPPRPGARVADTPGHRRYGEVELRAAELALELEQRFGVGPTELAFGLRVLAEPGVAARLRELGERTGRLKPPSTRALDFEKERALRWLGVLTRGTEPPGNPGRTVADGGVGTPRRRVRADHADDPENQAQALRRDVRAPDT